MAGGTMERARPLPAGSPGKVAKLLMPKAAQLNGTGTGPAGAVAAGIRKYLYAVIEAGPEKNYGPLGILGREVYSIGKGRVALVVSDLDCEKIRPERRHLTVHQQVLQLLLRETTPLPMAFGIIADNLRAVQKLLAHHHAPFEEQLRYVAGKAEMGLRMTCDVPNIFEYFVHTHPELKSARDHLLGGHREPAQEDKIEVGRLFDRLLQEDRDSCGEQVEAILAPHCSEVKTNRCRDERQVLNLACLVAKDSSAEFEAAVLEAAQLFDNNFAFDYNGPWAPHSFVNINLELGP